MASSSGSKDSSGRVIDEPFGSEGSGERIVVSWSDVIPDEEEVETSDFDPSDETNTEDGNESSKSGGSEDKDDPDLDVEEESKCDETEYVTIIGRGSKEDQTPSCQCRVPATVAACYRLLNEILELDLSHSNYECALDNLIRCVNFLLNSTKKPIDYRKMIAVDMFYRVRHELLFKSLLLSYGIGQTKSDVPFKSYGIDSNKTPDLILDHEGMLIIIEVSATSSYEKGAISKGVEEAGFESKYKKEMDLLKDKGIDCVYLPVIYNMSDTTGELPISQFSFLEKNFKKNHSYFQLMKTMYKSLSIITNEWKENMIVSSAILFSKEVDIEIKHPNHSFLYRLAPYKESKKSYYKEICISPPVYSKVSNNWERFYRMLENDSFTDNDLIAFSLWTDNQRFKLEKDSTGLTRNQYIDILNNNDKITFFNNLRLYAGKVKVRATESDSGIKFYERVHSKQTPPEKTKVVKTFNNHSTTLFSEESLIPELYFNKAEKGVSFDLINNFYDDDYEDKLLRGITQMDMCTDYESPVHGLGNLLGNLDCDRIKIKEVMENIEESYRSVNSRTDTLPIKILKMKQPFTLPIAEIYGGDYCGLSDKPYEIIDDFLKTFSGSNPYTSKILQNVCLDTFEMFSNPKVPSRTLRELINKRIECSNSINQLQKEIYKNKTSDGEMRVSKTRDGRFTDTFNKLKSEIRSLNKEIKSRQDHEGVKNKTSFVRLPTKGKGSHLRGEYQMEMSHFKNKKVQSTIEGVGVRTTLVDDYEADLRVFRNINEALITYRGKNPDPLIDMEVSKDSRLLEDLKKITVESYRELVESVTNSALGHSCALVSRMAHSLLYYSQLPFGSDYVRVDNLGYKNVLLIVKGGKKIFKSKGSKLYRLIYPIETSTLPWYTVGHQQQSSTLFFSSGGRAYAVSPWQIMHESVLCEAVSFYPRVCSFVVLNCNPDAKLNFQYDRLSLNVLLSFHNRRQTEVLLANMRYILLSTLGDFTGVTEILPEFFGFNYDCFQAFVRSSILYNYPVYFETLNNLKASRKGDSGKEINKSDFVRAGLKNIFTGCKINSTEDLALMIYSTFLMTKAPYQRPVERANNLKGILKIHEQYDKSIGNELSPVEQFDKICVTLNNDYLSYSKKLFENDFNIDPKYCSLVGNFMDSVFKEQGQSEEIYSSWFRILGKTWDELSTSTGLRGEYEDVENFWGKKGYFVVYKGLVCDANFRNRANGLLNSDLTDSEKRKILKDLNIDFYSKVQPEREFLIFHAVDKVQWRGGREIYVMDLMTKTVQQPIEQFMAELCKRMDNELISIPSNKRSQVIHHSIFEKDLPMKNLLTWYLTLDCTKWAPKSVFVKFALSLLSMRCVPSSFKIHFLNYVEKLYLKRVYFNVQEVDVLKNNPEYKKICEQYLKYDENVKGYYLTMQYSWMMGIFNYTSSFLHAANQKYFSYLLMKSSLNSYQEESKIIMFAHSDDSGGRLTVSSKPMARRALLLYEVNLKACNHLLSKKKSVISRIYFEILSIIYLFKQLLALLPKFLGGLRFLPTDKGPAQDMLQSYSKCIEVMVAGANFGIAYLVMKFYSMMVWRFYNHCKPSRLDYQRPVQYLGMPDAHPLMVLLCGSDSDLLRLIRDPISLSHQMAFVQTLLGTVSEAGPIKPLKFVIKVRGISKGFEEAQDNYAELIEKWSVRNVNYHNSFLNLLSFLGKLNDAGFVGSLVNESTVRRLSRCFFMGSGESCVTRLGNIKIRSAIDAMNLYQSFTNRDKGVEAILDEFMTQDTISSIKEELEESLKKVEGQMKILTKTMASPLKIDRYLDQLSMEGRKIVNSTRTLKPTVVQLTRTAKVFSTDFDPPTLVSYVKEPEMRWAIQDPRNLILSSMELEDFCKEIGVSTLETSPDDLLRVCRTYGRESVKTLYLYSKVPSELRQIKSYSSFLTFLSANSFDNKEIEGLVIKLTGKEATRDYIDTNINQEVYMVNNIISAINVFSRRVSFDFLREVSINRMDDLSWGGGGIFEFIKHLNSIMEEDIHYCILKPQLVFLIDSFCGNRCPADKLYGGAFYFFPKRQKVRGGWYGKGELTICIEKHFYSFTIFNTEVTAVHTNKVGKLPMHHDGFIRDVFLQTNLNFSSVMKKKGSSTLLRKMFFGIDNLGGLTVADEREVSNGVQCTITENPGGFMKDLHLYSAELMEMDHIDLFNRVFETVQKQRIYFLPIKKSEISPIINMLFKKEDFEGKLMQEGLNDFEEFVLTEIMTEYGDNNYIGFEEFIDGYTGSKLYEILKHCSDKSVSKIPKSYSPSILPAQEGSLTRIFLDYSRDTNEKILEAPKTLDPDIMQLRSEYADSMSVVLSENLVEYHTKIYTEQEQKEISDAYYSLSESTEIEERRSAIIKLMTFWGYGSLVNSIENFTFTRSSKNYTYFNRNIRNDEYRVHYSQLFPFLISKINKCLDDFSSLYSSADYPYPNLKLKHINVVDISRDYAVDTCLSIYGYLNLGLYISIDTVRYFNLIDAFMKEADFVASLQMELSSNYILNSIQIGYKNRKDLYLMINNLKDCWVYDNKARLNLNFIDKLQRLPDNTINYRSMISKFHVKSTPQDVYYHGFLDSRTVEIITRSVEIQSGMTKYRVTSKLSKPSEIKVPANGVIKFKRPLKPSILEDPGWEEIEGELEFIDGNEDIIEELWQELNDPYLPKVTKVMNVSGNRLVRASVKWIPYPYGSCKESILDNLRQVGENIVLLTNVYYPGFVLSFPNSGVRVVSYSRGKFMLAYYSFQPELSKEGFIEKFVGGEKFKAPEDLYKVLLPTEIRDSDGIPKDTRDLGMGDAIVNYGKNYKEVDGVTVLCDKGEGESGIALEEDDVEQTKYKAFQNVLDDLSSKGLSKETINRLKQKYVVKAVRDKVPISIIMSSLIKAGDLNLINEMIKDNKINLTPEERKFGFSSPKFFGLSYGLSGGFDPKAIKNTKVRAELSAVHQDLPPGVGSGSLSMSQEMRKILKSNMALWKNAIRNTKVKRENKTFLYTLMLSFANVDTGVDDQHYDYMWQDMINKSTNYVAQEADDEESDEEFLSMMFDFIASTRLRYRPQGM